MKRLSFLLTFAFVLGFTLTSCNDENDDACATWDGEVKAIIESTCSYSGCHSGGTTASMFLAEESNDFTSYAAIKNNLDNGNFMQRVLVDQNMPNPMFVPAGNPTELTQAQLDLLQCWADAGYPES